MSTPVVSQIAPTHAPKARPSVLGRMRTRLFAASAVCALAALPLSAQQPTYSSSSNHALLAGEDIDGSSLASSPTPVASPQYGGSGGGYSGYHESRWSHIAFEAGGGVTVPIGNDVNGGFTTILGNGRNYGTDLVGANLMVGAGWNFSKRFALLGEYEFNTNKIPGKTLSAVYNSSPSTFQANNIPYIGGNIHTNSVTIEPMYYFLQSEKRPYSAYVIGGFGYYHKTLNFTAPVVQSDFYYGTYVTNQTFQSYGDSGMGANFGTGIAFKPFGSDSRAKLFGEVRYVWADTPRESATDATNGTILHTGTEGLIPITVGLRF